MRAALFVALLCLAAGVIVSSLLGVPEDGHELVWGLAISAGIGLALGVGYLFWILHQKNRRDR